MGQILYLILLLALLLFAGYSYILGNCGLIGLVLGLIILVPQILYSILRIISENK